MGEKEKEKQQGQLSIILCAAGSRMVDPRTKHSSHISLSLECDIIFSLTDTPLQFFFGSN
jgi:hypothetical protein